MADQTKLLSILHYVWGGFQLIAAIVLLVVFLGGSQIASMAIEHEGAEPPPGWVLPMIGSIGLGLFILVGLFAVLNILSGTWIAKRRNRTFSMVIAGLNCLSIPLGLALAIYTFITLSDKEVMMEYRTVAQGAI